MSFFGRRSSNDSPESVTLSGYESDESFEARRPDWETDAADLQSAVTKAVAWIGTTDRQVEVIEVRRRSGSVVALVTASGIETIRG